MGLVFILCFPVVLWAVLVMAVFEPEEFVEGGVTRKAQDAYVVLGPDATYNYDPVRLAVLRAYELVPEAYRQQLLMRRVKNIAGFFLPSRWCAYEEVEVPGSTFHWGVGWMWANSAATRLSWGSVAAGSWESLSWPFRHQKDSDYSTLIIKLTLWDNSIGRIFTRM